MMRAFIARKPVRLATFSLRGATAQPRLGVLSGQRMLDLSVLAAQGAEPVPNSMKALLAEGDAGLERVKQLIARADVAGASHALDAIEFLPPISDAHKFLCVGKNYRTHLAELQRTNLIKELPEEPTGFIKLNDCLTGHDTDVVRPASVVRLDYEPELVFVIGKPAYGIKAEDAFSYVAGITILNDLTCRDTQKREVASGSRFWTAKNAPGFGPLGPCII
ncbi:MAG: fumarylacetoacetate hydrolase family protein, partial [Rubrivivax sp.]